MFPSLPRSTLVALALSLLACPAIVSAAESCKLAKAGELPLRESRYGLVTEGFVNGQKVGILIDTVSRVSSVGKSAAQRLGMELHESRADGYAAGRKIRLFETTVDELRLGSAKLRDQRMYVYGEGASDGEAAVVLGADLLREMELEFDLPNRVLRLFVAEGCGEKSLAYWAPEGASMLPLESGWLTVFRGRINGSPSSFMLDTGWTNSIVSERTAASLDIHPDSSGASPAGCGHKYGKLIVPAWSAPFDRIEIGGEAISSPRLWVADLWRNNAGGELGSRIARREHLADMVLGADFLASHRVLVSHRQRRIYFTYSGGLVFPAMPGMPCEDPGLGRGPADLAALDAALARKPSSSVLLYRRAVALAGQKQWDRAIADLDAVLRLNPRNSPALMERSSVHRAKKDYDKAIADIDAAIASGARGGWIYSARGDAWRGKGEFGKASDDYSKALELEPRRAEYLPPRAWAWWNLGEHDKATEDCDAVAQADPEYIYGRVWCGMIGFYAGRFGLAERDLARVMLTHPHGYWASTLFLARARSGKDGSQELRKYADGTKETGWPMPIVRFHLAELDGDGLLAAAAHADPKIAKNRECEARYHLGQKRLLDGDRREAESQFRQAEAGCPRSFFEYVGAVAELQRLK